MKTLEKIIIAIGVLCLVVIAFNHSDKALGSVMQSGEYQATTTSTMTGEVPLAARTFRVIQGTQGTLGSIVIASTSPLTTSLIRIWNATSTTDIASTSVGVMSTAAVSDTYTYDVILTRGLIVELPAGFNGGYTITYR